MQITIVENLKRTAANLATPIRGKQPQRPRAFSVMNGPAAGPYNPPEEEGFAAKLKQAVKARRATHSEGAVRAPFRAHTRQAHKDFVEQENARYRPFLQRREHCRGE